MAQTRAFDHIMNSAERWERVKDVFEGALSRSGGERRAYLDGACGSDAAMLREVESLLASFDDEYLEGAAVDAVADSFVTRNSLALKPGAMLGQYRIVAELGKGGQGAVYRAEDTNLHRAVAVKVLPRELTIDETARKRFQREARIASSLDHPNICAIYDLAEIEGTHFIVMQYVEGKNVRELLNGRPLDLARALKIGIQVCDALAEAHARGIIHRDIKAHNVIVTPNGTAKVLDFGLAKLTIEGGPDRTELTALGSPYGTPTYAAPEQSRGEKVDHRADIFSAGVLMYELLTGTWAFDGKTSIDVRHAVLYDQPQPIARKRRSPVPDRLDALVMKALEKQPERRFQSVVEMRDEMIGILREMPDSSEGGTAQFLNSLGSRAPVAGRFIPRGLAVSVSIVILLAIAISGYYAFRGSFGGPESLSRPAQRRLTRFTFEPGLQSEPSWSRDGQYIAYHSDQGGNFDIWIQQVSGGNPVQVTKSTAHDWQPDLSPNGENVVFRSEREGGGLFIMQALGGGERRLSTFGYDPRWSPDGQNILFYNSNLNGAVTVPKLFVQGVTGKDAVEVWPQATEEFQGFLRADWHPDGKRVSFLGQHRQKGFSFWTVPIDGGEPVRSEVSAEVERDMNETGVAFSDFVWGTSGTSLYLEGDTNGVRNLWRVSVDPDSLQWVGGPDRLTTGAGTDTDISVSPDGNRLAFTTRAYQTRVWSAPLTGGRVRGDPQPLTSVGMDTGEFSLSRDRKKLVFAARRAGKTELWERSMTDGRERLLLTAPDEDIFSSPRWSPDGSQVAFALNHNPDQQRRKFIQAFEKSIVLLPVDEGGERPLTTPNMLQGWPWDWSPDGRFVLGSSAIQTADPEYWGLYLFPVAGAPRAEGQQTPVVVLPGYNLWQGRFSPDGKWITFLAVDSADQRDSVIGVIPVAGGPWKRLAINDVEKPRWSADGRTIYFYSSRGGSRNVWGVKFDPASGTTVGDPFRVTSFESPDRMLMAPPSMGPHATMLTDLVVDTDKLLFNITQMTGSIWILDNVDH